MFLKCVFISLNVILENSFSVWSHANKCHTIDNKNKSLPPP